MTVYRLDPLEDRRWLRLITCHPRATVFHTRRWLDALKRTYGYQPIAFTICRPDEELRSAVVFCEIKSWLTGARLVSLPFSDHCDPLVDDADELAEILHHLDVQKDEHGWRYIELRPFTGARPNSSSFAVSATYVIHALQLCPDLDTTFRAFHKSSVRQRILRAQREGVVCEEGNGLQLLREFYRLHVVTRRRHGLPPQPFEWFCNLSEYFGEQMTIRVARYQGNAIASNVTLRQGATMVYKYGASDASHHPIGGIHFLLWNAIQAAAVSGCVLLDLGRTEPSDDGLRSFKERWGTKGTPFCYWRCPVPRRVDVPRRNWMVRCGAQAMRRAPARLRVAAGRIMYRHLG